MKCPKCGQEIPIEKGWEYSRFIPGPKLQLDRLRSDEKAIAEKQCDGWIVLKRTANSKH